MNIPSNKSECSFSEKGSLQNHLSRSDPSRLIRRSDFFTEFLRQFFKCWAIEERSASGWIVIPPLGNPPVGVISDLVFRFDLTVLQQFGKLLQSLSSPISSTGTPSMVNSA